MSIYKIPKNLISITFILFCTYLIGCKDIKNEKEHKIKLSENMEVKDTSKRFVYFEKAGVIKIKDSYEAIVGKDIGVKYFEIKLNDIEKYFGYVDADVAAAFIMNKLALNTLYDTSEVPQRGKIMVAVSEYNSLVLITSYITGAKLFLNQNSLEKSNLFVDREIRKKDKHYEYTIIFGRRDKEKRVKVTFDKTKLLSSDNIQLLDKLAEKARYETITDSEKTTLSKMVMELLEKVINESSTNSFKLEEIDKYEFKNN